jgi:DNA-binding SARP family transcriptional activator
MLFLKTLGGLSVEVDGLPGTGAAHRRKTLALLALLAAAGRRGISRDKLTAYLWPESDSEHARNLLKQASHALRRDLSAPDLFLGAIEVRLNPGAITSDLETFEEALDRGDLARAVAAYTGPFLDGFYLTDAAEFERWVDETRAALKRRVGEALEALAMRAAAHGDTPLAVNSWHRFVELEPLSGKAALGLVRALIAAKERTAALEFGRAHEAIVRRELGIAPDPDLSQLLRQLREEADEAPVRAAADTGLAPGIVAVAGASKVRPRPMRLGRRVSVAASLLIIAAAVVVGDSGRVARDPHLLAVAPFEVFDSSLAPWGEGLAHLVSRNLDGVGPFRSLAPGVPIRRSKGYADRAAAERFGRRTGAGLVLFGDLVRVASDSVRLRATVVDRDRDRPVAEFDRLDQVSRIDRLADSLSLAVMRALVPSTSAAYRYLRSPRTASLLALKAFLQGE